MADHWFFSFHNLSSRFLLRTRPRIRPDNPNDVLQSVPEIRITNLDSPTERSLCSSVCMNGLNTPYFTQELFLNILHASHLKKLRVQGSLEARVRGTRLTDRSQATQGTAKQGISLDWLACFNSMRSTAASREQRAASREDHALERGPRKLPTATSKQQPDTCNAMQRMAQKATTTAAALLLLLLLLNARSRSTARYSRSLPRPLPRSQPRAVCVGTKRSKKGI